MITSLFVALTFNISLTIVITWQLVSFIPIKYCSPPFDPTHFILITKLSTLFVVTLQLVSTIFIVTVYIFLIRYLIEHQKAIEESVSKKKLNTPLFIQLVVLGTSNILCWIPFSVIYISTIHMNKYPIEMVIWIIFAIVPVNALVNPFMIVFNAIRKWAKNR